MADISRSRCTYTTTNDVKEIDAFLEKNPKLKIQNAERQLDISRLTIHRVLHSTLGILQCRTSLLQQPLPNDYGKDLGPLRIIKERLRMTQDSCNVQFPISERISFFSSFSFFLNSLETYRLRFSNNGHYDTSNLNSLRLSEISTLDSLYAQVLNYRTSYVKVPTFT